MRAEAAAWLAKSDEDRLAAEWLLQSEAPLLLAQLMAFRADLLCLI